MIALPVWYSYSRYTFIQQVLGHRVPWPSKKLHIKCCVWPFYICFFIQYCYFWYVHGISCCVIFCYVIWCIHKSHLGVFALCYLHCCCVHSCICLFWHLCGSFCLYTEKREKDREREGGERQGGRERRREGGRNF